MTDIDYILGESLWEMMQRVSALNKDMFDSVKLGYSQYSALMYIGYEEGLSIKKLAISQSVEKSTAGKTVQRLERKGLINRKQNPEDKGGTRLYLTPEGRSILPELNNIYDIFLEKIFSPLSAEEKDSFHKLNEKINRRLR